jgi:hypothetical protein
MHAIGWRIAGMLSESSLFKPQGSLGVRVRSGGTVELSLIRDSMQQRTMLGGEKSEKSEKSSMAVLA